MSNRRSSDAGAYSQQHYASMKLGSALYRIAKKLPPNPKVVRKEKGVAGGGWNIKISDEQVTGYLVRQLQGESYADLAREAGVSYLVFRQWRQGVTRQKCLMEAEKRYAKIVSAGP